MSKKKERSSEKVDIRRTQGYVGIKPKATDKSSEVGFAFLRKHGDKKNADPKLFVGNIPEPRWRPEMQRERVVPADVQTRIRKLLKLMIPSTESVGDIFGIGNGRLATRIDVKGGEKAIDKLLAKPQEHVYMEYWIELHEDVEKDSKVTKWLKEYNESRDANKVLEWSNATMKAFEHREKKKAEESERMKTESAVPDEDGFVTVTDGARQIKASDAQNLRTGGRTSKGRYKSKSSRNRKVLLDVNKGIEKAGFYRWQRQNQNVLVDLQRKFKDDKKRIAAVRALEGMSYSEDAGDAVMADDMMQKKDK